MSARQYARSGRGSRLAGPLTVLLLTAVLLAHGVPTMSAQVQDDSFAALRLEMVEKQIRKRGVTSQGVLGAMGEVPRHKFVPESIRDRAYFDAPQPIGSRQTISQPYIVALMTDLLELDEGDKVLEIGTGSGYQAAVLAELAEAVYTIEIRESLARKARRLLTDLGYTNVHFRTGDGYAGWPEEAPFDGIIVTAAPEKIPDTLIEQLEIGARMVIPVGDYFQDLMVITRTEDGTHKRYVAGVRFVPMVTDPEE